MLDDFSRYIVAWRLGPTMCASDVTATLDQALTASGLDHINVKQRPRLLSDNGSSYVAVNIKACNMCAALRIIPKPRARSSAGIKNRIIEGWMAGTVSMSGLYVGVSPTTFDRMIKDGLMPGSKAIYGRRVWDKLAVDEAFDILDGGPPRDSAGRLVYEFSV